MSVPDFQSLMLPVLEALIDDEETSFYDVRKRIAESKNLTDDDLREMLPSGRQQLYANRVSWAATHLKHAGLIEHARRGVWRLTKKGKMLLADAPSHLSMKYLSDRYKPYAAWQIKFRKPPSSGAAPPIDSEDSNYTPEEIIANAERRAREELENDVLSLVRKANPKFLEQVVVDLLISMGYGGGDVNMGSVTGKSGDGGIDGVIKEDALGLDEVYVQTKRFNAGTKVSSKDVREFIGAIDEKHTSKGVFVTTESFTPQAMDQAKNSTKRIVLIDGEELARLMVEFCVGVRLQSSHKIQRIDEDYFNQETN